MTSKFSKVILASALALATLLAGCSKGPTEADLNLATAKQKANECVEPENVIRTKHMDMLMHQRDATMIEGIRTKQHSLNECINCHVAPVKADGSPLRYGDDEHFCTTCHAAVGQKIDCFQCHADRPAADMQDYQHKVGSAEAHHFTQGVTAAQAPSAAEVQMVAQPVQGAAK
ncbi:MAG TPA: hypothetical protein PLE99_05180 [Candidatus Thiothrix moscowensis]|uniref:hypothetical protein n=1 Tax=unclassified Thiothrix TaxID=2636184 RepID=UPI001A185301|nr:MULTISPECIES: hypothetical protein [unclassified Thiothrix]MBJ6609192.1 hypothetical protein [Candidatus Thiothrix moscowensis]HRJ52137.1 hypothetical protein [Candidatus Thiothrix moscowensis]HRJ92352.1 hypothetical protein [Candidatus Thiothrix moscowensis]